MSPRFVARTPFGVWIKSQNKSAADVAKTLGFSRSYVWMLAVGKTIPSMRAAAKIQAFTFGEVPVTTWTAVAHRLS